jgi:hypothetical protein
MLIILLKIRHPKNFLQKFWSSGKLHSISTLTASSVYVGTVLPIFLVDWNDKKVRYALIQHKVYSLEGTPSPLPRPADM